MVLNEQRRIETGAFYTPKILADLAVKYMKEFLPRLEDWFFWDIAAGEGALLEALPESCEKYATTLEYDDVRILRDKGISANQFDFLDGDISKLKELYYNRHRLILFTNPPYFKLKTEHDCYAKRRYKTNDSTALFYYRIFKEIKPVLLCGFNKIDLYQGSSHQRFRNEIPIFDLHLSSFLTPSCTWGLKGNFPIMFNILMGGYDEGVSGPSFTSVIQSDVYEIFKESKNYKNIYNYDK